MFRESLHIISDKLKVIPNSIIMLGGAFNADYVNKKNADNREVHQKLLGIIADYELG